jgi:uncharacterized protein YlxW (UPF0749 family)
MAMTQPTVKNKGGLDFNRTSRVAVILVCVVLGMMLALQIKVQANIRKELPQQRVEDLTARLKAVEEQRDKLADEVSDLRVKLAEAALGKNAISSLETELMKARVLAGLIDVTGSGVTVRMDDSNRQAKPGEDPGAFIIHDDDILNVLNELFAAGAEAIAINGERVVANTEVRCVGPTISINNTRIAPPIEIAAIGDSQTLENALKMRGGVVETLSFWGIEVSVKKEALLVIPAYKGPLNYKYAKPVTQMKSNIGE